MAALPSDDLAAIEEVLAAMRTGKYRTAVTRLSHHLDAGGTAQVGSEASLAFLYLMTGLLAFEPDETTRLLFAAHAKLRSRSNELTLVQQIAFFYRSLHVDGTRKELDAQIRDLEAANAQLSGRFTAAVLCARAALAHEVGEDQSAIDFLKRAWARSESFGGLCPAGLSMAIIASAARLNGAVECNAWLEASAGYGRGASCCNLRYQAARTTVWAMTDGGAAADFGENLTLLEAVESPTLVARCAVPLLHWLATPTGSNAVDRDELADRLSKMIDVTTLPPTTAFDVQIAFLDLRITTAVFGAGTSADRDAWDETERTRGAGRTGRGDRVNTIPDAVRVELAELTWQARTLDERLGCSVRTGQVDARARFIGS